MKRIRAPGWNKLHRQLALWVDECQLSGGCPSPSRTPVSVTGIYSGWSETTAEMTGMKMKTPRASLSGLCSQNPASACERASSGILCLAWRK